MNKRQLLLNFFRTIGLLSAFLVGTSACGGSVKWKEEVLLHDGSKIIVTRTVERGGRHEIGQQPPIKEQSLIFNVPATDERITWKSGYSEDVGLADFMPLLLDIFQGRAYMVTAPVGCLSYNKWGRPNPPYVIFQHQGKEWKRISLQELPSEIKTPNLIFSSPDNEVERMGKSFVSAETINEIIAHCKQPEYKSILRDAYPTAAGQCEELINYKGYWIMPNDPVARGMVDRKAK